MKKSIFLFLTLLSFVLVSAQEEDSYVYGDTKPLTNATPSGKDFDWGKVTIGGNLGATFGSITYIEIAPTMGYYLTKEILRRSGPYWKKTV